MIDSTDFGNDDFSDNDFSNDDFSDNDFSDNDFSNDDFNAIHSDTTLQPIRATRLNDNEVQMDLSVEDFLNGTIVIEEEEFDKDMEDFNQMKRSLESLGYVNLEHVNFDIIEALAKRSAIVDNEQGKVEEIAGVKSEMLNSLHNLHEKLTTSKATLQPGDSIVDPDYIRDNVSTGSDDAIYMALQHQVRWMINAGQEFTAESVLASLPNFKMTDTFTKEDLVDYVNQITEKLRKHHTKMQGAESNERRARDRISQMILQSDRILFARFNKIEAEHIHFFKNLQENGNSLVTVCEECGKQLEMKNTPVSFIMLLINKSQNSADKEELAFITPVQCECGACYLFTRDEYQRMIKEAIGHYRIGTTTRTRTNYLDSIIDSVGQLCHGAVFTKVNPPVSCITDALPELIRDPLNYVQDENENETDDSKKAASILYVDDVEFRAAVDAFYEKLKGYSKVTVKSSEESQLFSASQEKVTMSENAAKGLPKVPANTETPLNSGSLSYSQLAVCMVDVLSLDYETLKTQAMFSLIFYIMENPILADYLNSRTIWEFDSDVDLLACLTEKTIDYLDPAKVSCLISLTSNQEPAVVTDGEYKKTEKEILLSLLGNSAGVISITQEKRECRKFALEFLRSFEEAFGYCKIINLSGINRNDLDRFVSDEESFEVFDRITDRMIINNYANEYYQKWILFKCVNVSNLNASLTTKTNKVEVLKSLTNMMNKFANSISQLCVFDLSRLNDCLESVAGSHEVLRKAYGYYQAGNFYRFCKTVAGITSAIDSRISDKMTERLNSCIDNIKKIFEEIQAKASFEAEFYLTEFNSEEIKSAAKQLEFISFGRYILKRDEGEKIEEFLARFEKLQASGQLDSDNAFDNYTLFKQHDEDVLTIASAAIFSSIGYSSYSTAVFMIKALEAVNQCGNPFAIRRFMNLDDYYLQSVENNVHVITKDDMEIGLTWDFHRVLSAYYFTQADKLVREISNAIDSEIITVEDGLTSCSDKKMNALIHLMESVMNYVPIGEEDYDQENTMHEILDNIRSYDLRKFLEGAT